VLISSENKKMRLFIETNIIPHIRKIILIGLLGFLGVAVLVPSMLPGALANNIWSIQAIQSIFSEENEVVPIPPPYHPHAEIWLDRQALRQMGSESGTIEPLPEETVPSDDPFEGFANFGDIQSLDVKASYLYQQGQYFEAIEIWQSIGQKAALAEAASEAASYGITSLAIQAYQAAFAIDPEAYALSYARSLHSSGQSERAIEVLNAALQAYPRSRSTDSWQVLIGDIYRAQTDWAEAERIYQEVLAENPGAGQAWIGMGWLAYQRDQDVVAAVEQFDTAIAVDPQSGAGQAAMGSLFTQRKQYDIAAEWYRVAYQQNRESPSFGLSYANALYNDGRTEQAIAEYQNLSARFPDYASAYYQLSWVYHQEGQPDQAVTAIETALSLTEGPDLSFILRANAIYQANQLMSKAQELYRSTETAFQEVIETFPDFPEPYLYIARFYEEFDQIESAITAYQQALAIDPENAVAAEALDRLQEGE